MWHGGSVPICRPIIALSPGTTPTASNHDRAARSTRAFSVAQRERPALKAALAYMRASDTLVVWRLDRLARSLKQLIETVEDLGERGIGLRSLTEAVDTTTAGGKLVFHLFAALAEFERGVIRERTLAGLQSARARGRLDLLAWARIDAALAGPAARPMRSHPSWYTESAWRELVEAAAGHTAAELLASGFGIEVDDDLRPGTASSWDHAIDTLASRSSSDG